MKRAFSLALTIALVMAAGMMAWAQNSSSQSLGDYARAAKKSKPAVKPVSKVYDNDNLPRTTAISTVGRTTEAAPEEDKDKDKKGAEAAAAADNPDVKKADAEKDKAKAAEEKKKAMAEWQKKLDAQKQKIDLLSRELNVMQREYQIRAAAFYADAGNRLRNAAQWDSEDTKYKQQIADKQKALDDAKAQLGDLEEQARKAGVPNAVAE
jgi:hypothetical protein